MNKRFLAPLLLLCSLSWSAAGIASPQYPSKVQQTLALPYRPTCSLCHAGSPGLGTATTLFAKALRGRGLTAGNPDQLVELLHAIETDKVDSDGDGVPDTEQLKQGRDPSSGEVLFNIPGEGGQDGKNGKDGKNNEAPPQEEAGCAVAAAGSPGRSPLAWLVGLAAVGSWRLLRRARDQRSA